MLYTVDRVSITCIIHMEIFFTEIYNNVLFQFRTLAKCVPGDFYNVLLHVTIAF